MNTRIDACARAAVAAGILGLAALTGCTDRLPATLDGQIPEDGAIGEAGADGPQIHDGRVFPDGRLRDLSRPDGAGKVCGLPGAMCGKSQVCNIKGCAPGSVGRCVKKPGSCPKLWAPVCGCDGKTYPNDCVRLQAGAALKHVGDCKSKPTDGGLDGPTTCGNFPGGTCNKGLVCNVKGCGFAKGWCVPIPKSCPPVMAPVCGCDGKTYPNDCVRLQVGVALKSTGPCKIIVDGGIPDAATLTCGPFSKCYPSQVCNIKICAPGASGTCVQQPKSCYFLWSPVCGCNNTTYSNDCFRLMAGMALKHTGQCKTDGGINPADAAAMICGPFPGGLCSGGTVCDIKGCMPGSSGVCVTKPINCPYLWKPVCGCNDQTYANDCIRLLAGMPLKYAGQCKGTPVDGGIIILD